LSTTVQNFDAKIEKRYISVANVKMPNNA